MRGELTEFEKEVIVDSVLNRINEMSETDKKQRNIINRAIMGDVTQYFEKRAHEYDKDHPFHGGRAKVNYPLLWHAFYEIRKLVPWIVSVRYSNYDNWDAFYKANPNADRREEHCTVASPMLLEDRGLATAIGMELVDILFKYLDPTSFEEVPHKADKKSAMATKSCRR